MEDVQDVMSWHILDTEEKVYYVNLMAIVAILTVFVHFQVFFSKLKNPLTNISVSLSL